jgi:hypothetical protein
MILDACRSNPFKRFRSLTEGLATMSASKGTLIAYATAPGSAALDGDGRNSPYTKHLLQSLKEPGLEVERIFKRVRASVLAETNNRQIPWESSSLVGEFFFVRPPPVASTSRPGPRPAPPPLPVTAEVTVRQDDERGPLVSGAKVSLWWRSGAADTPVVLGEVFTDTHGVAKIAVKLTPDQQAKGEFAAQVSRGAASQNLRLTSFLANPRFSIYLPRPAAPPTRSFDGHLPGTTWQVSDSAGDRYVFVFQ